jgi:hypothetical protein
LYTYVSGTFLYAEMFRSHEVVELYQIKGFAAQQHTRSRGKIFGPETSSSRRFSHSNNTIELKNPHLFWMMFRRKKGSDASIPTTVALSHDTSDEDEDNVDHLPLQLACKLTIQAAIRKRDRLGIVRIKVPDYSSESQVPASIICVIDISSSNDDQSRVHMIKHATKKVIKTLGAKDQIAIITYADNAEVVLPFMKMTPENKEVARQIVDSLQAHGRSNLWSGLLQAIRTASGLTADVFLFCNSVPEVHPPRGEIESLIRCKQKHSHWSCRISTFGFGYNINSKLLHGLSMEGDGQYCFIPDSSFVGTVLMSATANILSTAIYTSFLYFDATHKNPWIEQTFNAEQEEESSRNICLYLPSLSYGQTLDFLVSHDIGMYQKCRELEGSYSGQSDFVSSFDIEVARLRGRLVSMIQSAEERFYNKNPQALTLAQAACRELIDEVNNAIEKFSGIDDNKCAVRFQAIRADLMGNISKAYSCEDWHEKWGKHYLLSLARGHELQRTTNFKDPGLQVYATKTLSLIRAMAGEEINKLPEPQPWFEVSDTREIV